MRAAVVAAGCPLGLRMGDELILAGAVAGCGAGAPYPVQVSEAPGAPLPPQQAEPPAQQQPLIAEPQKDNLVVLPKEEHEKLKT